MPGTYLTSQDFIDRRREMLFFEAVAHRGLGPRLLGTFANGRVEEYIPAPVSPS